MHLGTWESYVRADVHGETAVLDMGTVVRKAGKHSTNCSVRWKILDASKNVVASGEAAPQTIAADADATFTASTKLTKPVLWSLDLPVLYTAEVSVESAGKICDAEEVSFGVRSIRFDADKGSFLNGKPVKIKGTCNHQDHAGAGAALPDRLQWYRLAVLKEMGSALPSPRRARLA